MRILLAFISIIFFASCWDKPRPSSRQPVMGFIPVYSSREDAKVITYTNSSIPVTIPGNIYVKGNYIYQLDIGKGIHVIDNSIPSQAHRIGFFTVNGSSQISIKGNHLYTNSYDELVVLDISNNNTVNVVKRVAGAFPEGYSNYYYIQPTESGYYRCPTADQLDSVVVGWKTGKVWNTCHTD